jgi:hypothetical protein
MGHRLVDATYGQSVRHLGLIAALLLLAACSSQQDQPVLAEGLEVLPSSSAVAWVTYADHMVVVQIDGDKRLEPTKDEVEAGEGFIPRHVALSVKKVLWSRSGTPAKAPTSMTWASGGWVFHGKVEQPLRRDGVPWLIPGHSYLVPITFTALSPNSSDKAAWIPLGSENAMPFDGGVVGRGEKIMIGSTAYNGSNPTGETAMRDFAWSKTGG